MAIKLGDVKGLMVDKILIEKRLLTDDDMTAKYCAEHGNAIITEQGSRKIGLNLDKLIDKINEVPYVGRLTSSVIASHLIKSESDLIEYVEDK